MNNHDDKKSERKKRRKLSKITTITRIWKIFETKKRMKHVNMEVSHNKGIPPRNLYLQSVRRKRKKYKT